MENPIIPFTETDSLIDKDEDLNQSSLKIMDSSLFDSLQLSTVFHPSTVLNPNSLDERFIQIMEKRKHVRSRLFHYNYGLHTNRK